MGLTSSVVSGAGRVREENQDNFYLNGPYNDSAGKSRDIALDGEETAAGFFAVADGMGGEKFGDLAALIAVSSLDRLDRSRGTEGILDYLSRRNEDICDIIRKNGGARSGSTFVGINLHDGRAELANIGDSRAYLFRSGELTQLSLDHTSVRAMVDMGVLTKENAAKHPGRHQLTQHLGIFPEEMLIEPYTMELETVEGDLFLLCSDGLFDMVDDGAIRGLLQKGGTPGELSRRLYSAAMSAGGKDNTTVMLISVGSKGRRRRIWK